MAPKIPLILKLKKITHKKIAEAQDIIIEELYGLFNEAVLHGGTTIWRCYNGNRFSEDIDVFIPNDEKKIKFFFENLRRKGFLIKKKKITRNALYSTLEFNKTIVRFEAFFKEVRGSLQEYETSEGNLVTVYALTPEELINEKIDAYLRRLKIRDLYDVFFLLRYVKNREKIKGKLKLLIKGYKYGKPTDEDNLKVLIIRGVVPNTDEIIDYIKRWL